jgi:hypothetical protein
MISAAFKQWPHGHPYQPTKPEALRAWLLIRVNHVAVEFIPYDEVCVANPSLQALFRLAVESTHRAKLGSKAYGETRVRPEGVEIVAAASIDYTLSQKDFNPIRDAVEDILESIIGVAAKQLLSEKAA